MNFYWHVYIFSNSEYRFDQNTYSINFASSAENVPIFSPYSLYLITNLTNIESTD